MRLFLLIGILFCLCGCWACSIAEYSANAFGLDTSTSQLLLMSFNVQNLFDAVDDGSEYYEFDPGNGNWGIEEYYSKLQAVSAVIRSAGSGKGPDLIAFQEIEKNTVLELLNNEFLQDLGYGFCYTAYRPDEAVQCGVLSRIPVDSVKCHAPTDSGRYIIELHLAPLVDGEGPITLFINHWKSKRGGVAETEHLRHMAADFLRHRIQSVSGPIIISGDLNWNTNITAGFLDEFGPLSDGAVPALGLPGSSSPLWLTRSRALFTADTQRRLLYDPWLHSAVSGSYFWDGAWDAIDHFLLSSELFDRKGWEFRDFEAGSELIPCDDQGRPIPFSCNSHTGCSDHLPVLLYLEFM